MRVVAFRHVPFEGAGYIETELEQRGITIEYSDLYRSGEPIPDTANVAGLIFLGGPMSVNDDLPYLREESRLLCAALDRGQPVLGICLGSQLMAKTLGAKVYRNARKEIGWFDIHLTEAGAGDPLFAGMGCQETVFHWHGETFDLPDGATHLAYSDACRHQAFRVGKNAYGLQFHLEVTPGMIRDWCSQDENCGDVRELDGPIDAEYQAEHMKSLAQCVFANWAELL